VRPELAHDLEERRRILEEVRRLLVEQLAVRWDADEIDPDAPLFNVGVGLDSVDAIELAFTVERTFGVMLPDGEAFAEATRTANRIVDYVIAQRRREP
jgi:acyl carrier protein